MKIPKIVAFLSVLAVLTFTSGAGVFAAAGKAEVYVTVSDGSIAVTAEKLTVTDADGDGAVGDPGPVADLHPRGLRAGLRAGGTDR